MNAADSHTQVRNAGKVLAIIVASYLMIVVDISIVITGLPRIQTSLGFTAAQLSWVTNAYTLAFGGLLLLGARAGDIMGRRRMTAAGVAGVAREDAGSAVELQDSAALAHRIAVVMDVAALLLGLALVVSWFFIVMPHQRRLAQRQQEALS